MGEHEAAVLGLNRALELSRAHRDQFGEADALNNLGIVQRLTGMYESANANLTLALDILRSVGSRHGESCVLSSLGGVQRMRGEYDSSIASLTQALEFFRSVSDRNSEAECLNNMGETWLASSDAQALRCHEKALVIAREIASPLEEARALEGMGQYFLQNKQPDEGISTLQQALGIYQKLKSPNAQRVASVLRQHGIT